MTKMHNYQGVTIVEGQGYGKAHFIGRAVHEFDIIKITPNEVLEALQKFGEIREEVKEYYRNHQSNFERDDKPSTENSILKIYEHIVDDPAFTGQVVQYVTSEKYSLESSIRSVSKEFIEKFNAAGTAYFRDRSSDMVEVCEKLVSQLHHDTNTKTLFNEDVVLVINRSFTPSDLINYDLEHVKAVISVSAGKTSHAAILARSYSIPVVTGIENLTDVISPDMPVFVDADDGHITIYPTDEMIVSHIAYVTDLTEQKRRGAAKWKGPIYTRDGVGVQVMANISFDTDVELANANGADGVGLVRTEYLLSEREELPTEEEQFQYYSAIIKGMESNNRETIIRVLDIGGDKAAKFLATPDEDNPFMGWRAIRILLEKKDIFETQLTAIMRAGQGHNYKIMYPMVTAVSEWRETRTFTQHVAEKNGYECPPLGVLFEVPLAILEMDIFLKDVDFASVGTNDLLQYLSAADRNNNKVNYLYNPTEPAFLKILKNAIETCKDHGIPISVCGEMAGNPEYTLLLVGLGLTRFSVIPSVIPILKEIISSISFAEVKEDIGHILSVESSESITEWIRRRNEEGLGDIFRRYHLESRLKL